MPLRRVLSRRRVQSCSRLLLLTAAALLSVALLYGEWLCYTRDSLNWPPGFGTTYPRFVHEGNVDGMVRVLIVADPQMLGYVNEGAPARWDCDRYLSLTFQHVFDEIQPQLVVFLGDIFDEGSTCTDDEFYLTFDRFFDVYKSLYESDSQMLFICGDNDVGGEGFEQFSMDAFHRFKSHFKDTFSTSAFDTTSEFFGADVFNGTWWHIDGGKSGSQGHDRNIRIVFSHGPLMKGYYYSARELLKEIEPSLILSAHDHRALMTTARNAADFRTYDDFHLTPHSRGEFQFVVKPLKGAAREIQSPTCSYRMGVPHMGFGLLYIDVTQSDERSMAMRYGVVWLPSRFSILLSYIVCAVMATGILATRFFINARYFL